MKDDLTIADLELYGLTTRTINVLEDRYGVMYAKQLSRQHLRQMRHSALVGRNGVRRLLDAIRNYINGTPTMTLNHCYYPEAKEAPDYWQWRTEANLLRPPAPREDYREAVA